MKLEENLNMNDEEDSFMMDRKYVQGGYDDLSPSPSTPPSGTPSGTPPGNSDDHEVQIKLEENLRMKYEEDSVMMARKHVQGGYNDSPPPPSPAIGGDQEVHKLMMTIESFQQQLLESEEHSDKLAYTVSIQTNTIIRSDDGRETGRLTTIRR